MGTPLFIVGTASSGTTLLRNILWSHPKYYSTHETNFFAAPYRTDEWYGLVHDKLDVMARRGPAHLQECPEYRFDFIKALADSHDDQSAFVEAYFESIRKYNIGDTWMEKTPLHILHLDTIKQCFPDSVVICTLRDPADTVASINRQKWFQGDFPWACEMWRREAEAFLKYRQLIDYCISYEALCGTPADITQKLFEQLGIDYNSEDATYHEVLKSQDYHFAAVYTQLSPIHTSSIGGGTATMDKEQRTFFEQHCGDLATSPNLVQCLEQGFAVSTDPDPLDL